MIKKLLSAPAPFADTAGKGTVSVVLLSDKTLKELKTDVPETARIKESGFTARPGSILALYNNKGQITKILAGISKSIALYDLASVADAITRTVSPDFLTSKVFRLEADGMTADALEKACLGWALASHRYDFYKKESSAPARLAWPKGVNKVRVLAMFEGIVTIRNLVNTPANDMGPDELEEAVQLLAKRFDAKMTTIKGKALENGFPLIHAVGISSPRTPRLIDLQWGNAKHPKLTLVGKGVCFDTGGLNLKPGQFMLQMKKDMGGSAHALGIALAIMALKLPVRLRVLIPAVENSVSGTSFRPRDVYNSRKGLTVETSDTDAEGRLVLADALALACEEKPDLLLDFSTLTGSARAALGYDIPAVFSNTENLAQDLSDVALAEQDPLWPLPLWQGYKKELASDIADLNNIGTSPAGAITGALFLEHFVEPSTPWVHIDMYAWEQTGKPGRPRGGSDTGMRAVVKFLEDRYSK
jgi:leucyl aminopeptidase